MTPGGDAMSLLTDGHPIMKKVDTTTKYKINKCSRQCLGIASICSELTDGKLDSCIEEKDGICFQCVEDIALYLNNSYAKISMGYGTEDLHWQDNSEDIGVLASSHDAYNKKHFPKILDQVLKAGVHKDSPVGIVTVMSGHSNYWVNTLKNFAQKEPTCQLKGKLEHGSVLAVKLVKHASVWSIKQCKLVIGSLTEMIDDEKVDPEMKKLEQQKDGKPLTEQETQEVQGGTLGTGQQDGMPNK